jgi:LacI family transcriptional regulator
MKLLEGTERPTAVFCATDLLAVGLLRACNEKKISVPDELSIVGCDNTSLAESSMPGLTSVDTHKAVLGRLAAEHLFDLIDDVDFPPITTMMPVRIEERESVRNLHTSRA